MCPLHRCHRKLSSTCSLLGLPESLSHTVYLSKRSKLHGRIAMLSNSCIFGHSLLILRVLCAVHVRCGVLSWLFLHCYR